MTPEMQPFSLDRIMLAVQNVEERLRRGAAALNHAELSYAVIGGCAVILWVEHHAESGRCNTPNVDFLVRRADLALAAAALEHAGFCPHPACPDLFQDGPLASPRTRLRLLFAEEKVRPSDFLPNPALGECVYLQGFPVLPLPLLIQTKLTAWRTIDRVHLRDMLDIGLIDASWVVRYPPELGARLQTLIDDPDG